MKENDLTNQASEVINGEMTILASIYNGSILVTNRNGKIVKDTYDID